VIDRSEGFAADVCAKCSDCSDTFDWSGKFLTWRSMPLHFGVDIYWAATNKA